MNYIDWGGGFGGEFLYALDPEGALGLRVNMGLMIYGYETKEVPLEPYGGSRPGRRQHEQQHLRDEHRDRSSCCRVAPSGRISTERLGLSYFFTHSSVEGDADYEPFASSTNFDDATFSWSAGGGLYIPRAPRAQADFARPGRAVSRQR